MPAEILPLVSASFSLAASAFVPGMGLGIFWPRTNRPGAVAGMLAGLGVTVGYLVVNAPPFRALFGMSPGQDLWFAIQPVSAGVFGVPTFIVSGEPFWGNDRLPLLARYLVKVRAD